MPIVRLTNLHSSASHEVGFLVLLLLYHVGFNVSGVADQLETTHDEWQWLSVRAAAIENDMHGFLNRTSAGLDEKGRLLSFLPLKPQLVYILGAVFGFSRQPADSAKDPLRELLE